MEISLGELTEGILTKHPHWYDRFTREEKIIVFNMLLQEGKYFDIKRHAIVKPGGSMTMGELREATGLS